MARTGLLVLKDFQSVSSISNLLRQVFNLVLLVKNIKKITMKTEVSQSRGHIQSTLFVKPNYDHLTFNSNELSKNVFQVISRIYSESDVHCPGIDVRQGFR